MSSYHGATSYVDFLYNQASPVPQAWTDPGSIVSFFISLYLSLYLSLSLSRPLSLSLSLSSPLSPSPSLSGLSLPARCVCVLLKKAAREQERAGGRERERERAGGRKREKIKR
eukprot:sb/3476937/